MPTPQTIEDLETPSVLLDMDKIERNIAKAQALCDRLGVQNRPHIKTHKIPALARMQLDAGAVGIACQKVSEAEVFADAGFDDIQIPYNIIGALKTARLAQLAKRVKLTVTVDSLPVVEGIAEAARAVGAQLNVLVELVSTNLRTGIAPEHAPGLAKRILENSDCLHFAGVMIYPTTPEAQPTLQKALDLLAEAHIPVEIISGGSSGLTLHAENLPELTEIRMGTYIFYDWRSVLQGWATFDECAMTIRATVVSAHAPDRIILDSGSKSISTETVDGLFGTIIEAPDARIYRVNEEHGFVDYSACDYLPKVGDIVHIIPVHTCVVTNLHNRVYGMRGDRVEQVFEVAARGLVW